MVAPLIYTPLSSIPSKATYHCISCTLNLCSLCKEAHERQRSTSNHHMRNILELRRARKQKQQQFGLGDSRQVLLKCGLHGFELKSFCIPCQQVSPFSQRQSRDFVRSACFLLARLSGLLGAAASQPSPRDGSQGHESTTDGQEAKRCHGTDASALPIRGALDRTTARDNAQHQCEMRWHSGPGGELHESLLWGTAGTSQYAAAAGQPSQGVQGGAHHQPAAGIGWEANGVKVGANAMEASSD